MSRSVGRLKKPLLTIYHNATSVVTLVATNWGNPLILAVVYEFFKR